MRYQPLTLPGAKLQSGNEIKVITLHSGALVLLKAIRPEVVYVPRLKVLGEVAYSLLDYHLNPAERVTPNVCPASENILWRQFIQGLPGEIWRGKLYKATGNLESADLKIVNEILGNRFAQRIALLDFIFLFQDRSARNWIREAKAARFWAVDNGMLWPYKGRHADRRVTVTGCVDHLENPINALVSRKVGFDFEIGIFSSLHAGQPINDGLMAWLYQIDWRQYFHDLGQLIGILGYPFTITDDWRFVAIELRARWLLKHRRFPKVSEAFGTEWESFMEPIGGKEIWKRGMETGGLDTS